MLLMGNGRAYSRSTKSVEETKELAATLAPFLRRGDIILLEGDLGAGKTQFVQAIASCLGVTENIVSPTFNIMLSYQGDDLELSHFDLYRLDSSQELEDVGYWEALEDDGVSFVEWGNKFPNCMPADYMRIRIECTGESTRVITCRSCGERGRRLLFMWAQDPAAALHPVPDSKRFL